MAAAAKALAELDDLLAIKAGLRPRDENEPQADDKAKAERKLGRALSAFFQKQGSDVAEIVGRNVWRKAL